MCGIAGVFRVDGRPGPGDAAAVLRMLDVQAHRGPDDWGLLVPRSLAPLLTDRDPAHLSVYSDHAGGGGAVLGVRRLAIRDVSSRGHMPMGARDGRVWVAHNGEVYNHVELIDALGPGAPLDSGADTEVILRAWLAWGAPSLARVRGMFALAIFEALPEPRLVLARDRLGIKPLYVHRDRERLVFASEVRALVASGLVPADPDPAAVIDFLAAGSVALPRTTVKGVSALPAGSLVTATARGCEERRFWRLDEHLDTADGAGFERAVASTRALLEEAVDLHLEADVPLGVFLSGGLDSSALVALASRARRGRLVTVSVGFDEPAYSETRYARLVADRHRTDHREVVLGAREFREELPRLWAAMDEPTADGANTYFVARAARQAGLTAVLSGIGSDEIFLGYDHLRRAPRLDGARALFARAPEWARAASIRAARGAGRMAGRGALDKLVYLAQPSGDNVYRVFRGLFTPGQIRDLLGVSGAEVDAAIDRAEIPAGEPLLGRFVRREIEGYLQSQLLKDADQMAMAHAIEVRVPYLDHRLVEHVLGLSPRIRLAGPGPKPLLRAAVAGDLPREVLDRPKMGFTFPFDPWMRADAGELEALSLEHPALDRRAVAAVWEGFRARDLHWSRPWALVALAQSLGARRAAPAGLGR